MSNMSNCECDILPSCPVCLELYSHVHCKRFPRILPCGHTFCQECLSDLLKVSALVICPQCRKVHVPSPDYGLNSFSKNCALIDLLESNDDNCNSSREHLKDSTTQQIVQDHICSESSCTEFFNASHQESKHVEVDSADNVLNGFSMVTSDQQLMTAIRNIKAGDILDLKGMTVSGEGPLYIDSSITLKNANLGIVVVMRAPSVALHNVNISLRTTSEGESMGKCDLVQINFELMFIWVCFMFMKRKF
eukprot:TRINITY_DN334_c1_g1_i2.p1 TRINITY_DN334_c1_g1~~TRINITY_DN334_c1_g1_i2.p1  ORF type:complete len:265 (-),score=-6.22 TRINITY_DN334_c1_g1_i2:37-780(-)